MLMKVVGGLVAIIAVILGGGWIYQEMATGSDLHSFPPPGRMVEVDGIAMHVDCRGEGEPTIVLESGLGNSSVGWYHVIDEIADQTRVCAYDRPGMGWSEPTDLPIAAGDVASRLHKLLVAAATEGPYVLGGWSAGGVYIREFQKQFPKEVLGMVFVDSSHEQQGDRLPNFGGGANQALDMCVVAQPFGVIRAMHSLDQLYAQSGVPADIIDVAIATSNFSHFCKSVKRESDAFTLDIKQESPPGDVGDIPLIVLTQGKPYDPERSLGMTEEQFDQFRAVWTELQEELKALSPRGERFVATRAGHPIQLDDPALVIDAFTTVLERLRRGSDSPGQNDPAREVNPETDDEGYLDEITQLAF